MFITKLNHVGWVAEYDGFSAKINAYSYERQKIISLRAVRFELTHLSIVELRTNLNLPP